MYLIRKYLRRYRRFREQTRLRLYVCFFLEFAVGIVLVYTFLAPLICR